MGKRAMLFGVAVAVIALWFGLSQRDSNSVAPVTVPTEAVAANDSSMETETRDDYLPAPFGERRIVFLEPGEAPPAETASFCGSPTWREIDLVVSGVEEGPFRVDELAWNQQLTGSKVGLASWMSQCHRNGGAVEIVADASGVRLAHYDSETGFRAYP